jgi:methionyl-tRNA formyltransferase
MTAQGTHLALTMKQLVLIGGGQMAVDCLRILTEMPHEVVSLAITEPSAISPGNALPLYCRKQGIPCLETERINSSDVIDRLSTIGPDIIFNINSFQIVRPRLLSVPKEGIVNFHNGPLPRYGGVNVCSWAIINGEKHHGVTWHYLDEGIDTGDIIAQRFFEIAPDETAITLIIKCINIGTALFREVLPRLIDGSVTVQRQDRSKATYYSLRDIPNGGSVDYGWPYVQLDRFIRGLCFHPAANTFVHPRSTYCSRKFFIQQIARLEARSLPGDCGKVIYAGPGHIAVQTTDSTIAITDVLDENENDISMNDFVERYEIKVGRYLGS